MVNIGILVYPAAIVKYIVEINVKYESEISINVVVFYFVNLYKLSLAKQASN